MVWDARIISGSCQHSCFSPLILQAFYFSSPGVNIEHFVVEVRFGRVLQSHGWRVNRSSSSQDKIKILQNMYHLFQMFHFISLSQPQVFAITLSSIVSKKLNPLPHTRIQRVVHSLEESTAYLQRGILCHVGLYPVSLI